MAIRIVEGVIGSGKTYYVVNHLVATYFRWDDGTDRYVAADDRTRIFTNISNLVIGEDLDAAVKAGGGLAKFFTVAYQKTFTGERRHVYVIDEAQRWFDRKFHNKEVFFFFQWSRHLGVDVYLVTQDVGTLSRELQNLAEYYVRARRRSLSMVGEFKYDFLSGPGGDVWKSVTKKPSRHVFALYRSMEAEEVEKVPSATRRTLAMAAGMIVILLVGMSVFGRFAWSAYRKTTPEAVAVAPEVPVMASGFGVPPAPAVKTKVDPKVGASSTVARFVGFMGDDDDGQVVFELDGGVVRVSLSEALRLCRCSIVYKRTGTMVPLYADASSVLLPTTATNRTPASDASGREDERAPEIASSAPEESPRVRIFGQ